MRPIAAALAVIPSILGACSMWPVGDDPTGTRLKAEAEVVLAGLRAYARERGQFPASLNELVPKFVPRQPSPEIDYVARAERISLRYTPAFSIGQVECSTRLSLTEWQCHGYV